MKLTTVILLLALFASAHCQTAILNLAKTTTLSNVDVEIEFGGHSGGSPVISFGTCVGSARICNMTDVSMVNQYETLVVGNVNVALAHGGQPQLVTKLNGADYWTLNLTAGSQYFNNVFHAAQSFTAGDTISMWGRVVGADGTNTNYTFGTGFRFPPLMFTFAWEMTNP